MDQAFVKDPEKPVKKLVAEKSAELGGKVEIRRFVRYEMGEGLQKREDNFCGRGHEADGQIERGFRESDRRALPFSQLPAL